MLQLLDEIRQQSGKRVGEALRLIIKGYTREAGVRSLEREIGRVLRYAAVKIAEASSSKVAIEPKDLVTVLGQPRFEGEIALRTSVPGVATGLAWTPVGGDILFIEASRVPGRGGLLLTGQLGDVMRESAQAAMTLVKIRASEFGVEPTFFEKSDIHVHVPAGATPKDGPSAGLSMFTALALLLTNRTVRKDTAMTGEILLRGLVLPVGGIKENVVAAAAVSAALAGVGERDDAFPLPHGRGNEFHHGSPGNDPRSLPPKGLRTRDIDIPDLRINSIKVKTRDFR